MQITTALELLVLLVIANAAPLLVGIAMGKRFDAPLDGGLQLADGRPLLGASKTVRGLVASLAATTLAAPLFGLPAAQGAGFAMLAMLGDLLSSFTKRRIGIATSRSAPLLDQLPESLLPLLVMQPALGANGTEILAATLIFVVIDWLYSWWRDTGGAA